MCEVIICLTPPHMDAKGHCCSGKGMGWILHYCSLEAQWTWGAVMKGATDNPVFRRRVQYCTLDRNMMALETHLYRTLQVHCKYIASTTLDSDLVCIQSNMIDDPSIACTQYWIIWASEETKKKKKRGYCQKGVQMYKYCIRYSNLRTKWKYCGGFPKRRFIFCSFIHCSTVVLSYCSTVDRVRDLKQRKIESLGSFYWQLTPQTKALKSW